MNKMFSLRTIIDDILLIVRNNNISESEDLSRALIAAWVLAYRAALLKQRKDKDDENVDATDTSLSELIESKIFKLKKVESKDNTPLFLRETEDEVDVLDFDERNIFSVTDQEGCIIQFMDRSRKFFHRFRKYTGRELTWDYDNKHIIVHGIQDCEQLMYIEVKGLFSHENDEDTDEDDIIIPGWMIPDIKKNIMNNELSFMLQRISDDDNNSTLDGIKPQPQLNEK